MSSKVTALQMNESETFSEKTQAYFDLCQEKLGLVPNVLKAYAFDDTQLRAFTGMYTDIMLADSGLSKRGAECIADGGAPVN